MGKSESRGPDYLDILDENGRLTGEVKTKDQKPPRNVL